MRWAGYAWAVGAAVACTLIGVAMRPRFDLVNVAMVFLFAVVIIALRFSRGPAILASVLGVATFDVLFVPPQGTFTVHDVQYLLTFGIMLAVGLIIAALKENMRKQAQAQAKLEMRAETERIRSTLLASISHDLRTPLAVMCGASSSLVERGERLSEEERRLLAKSVYDQAREMSEQVAKVLQMTRLETGEIVVQRDWDSFSDIAGSVLQRLRDRLGAHRLLVELPDNLPLLRVDAVLIDQALSNLLENAAKHTPSGTLVRLHAEQEANELVVSVEDYGPGLPEQELERIFAKFERGSPEGSGGGVGLGLSICRAIVRLHGGRVWAEQLAGGGTAFRFSLPIEPAPPMPVEAAA